MADIKIQDLSTQNVSGMNLFNDSESFMIDLFEEELTVQGGRAITSIVTVTTITSGSILWS